MTEQQVRATRSRRPSAPPWTGPSLLERLMTDPTLAPVHKLDRCSKAPDAYGD